MQPEKNSIRQLREMLEELLRKQESLMGDIQQLKDTMIRTLEEEQSSENIVEEPVMKTLPVEEIIPLPDIPGEEEIPAEIEETITTGEIAIPVEEPVLQPESEAEKTAAFTDTAVEAKKFQPVFELPPAKKKSNLERFIGENLISKIGIAITVIGVGIGAKYAIDHDLISPLARIILGYVLGFGFLGTALKLKKNYKNFSAVLLSGGFAITYLMTLLAHNLYAFIPGNVAFPLMVIITATTVFAAIRYNTQVIAHFGLVGAYAVPFLLGSEGSAISGLLVYVAIINIGILCISILKYWKPLFYSAFIFTWAIFGGLYLNEPESGYQLADMMVFPLLYFVIFQVTLIAYKVRKKEKLPVDSILLLVLNSIVMYVLVYVALEKAYEWETYGGLFTLLAGIYHGILTLVSRSGKITDKILVTVNGTFALLFILIAVPVQFEGKTIIITWAAMASALYITGRTRKSILLEVSSYPVFFFSLALQFFQWITLYGKVIFDDVYEPVILNSWFMTDILMAAFMGIVNLVNHRGRLPEYYTRDKQLKVLLYTLLSGSFIVLTYMTFFNQINIYFNNAYIFGEPLGYVHASVILAYTAFFLVICSVMNIRWLKNVQFGSINIVLNFLVLLPGILMAVGFLRAIRGQYLSGSFELAYNTPALILLMRYVVYFLLAVLLYMTICYLKREAWKAGSMVIMEFITHAFSIIVLSDELVNWLDIAGFEKSDQLTLSILWGVYALFMIVLGIRQRKKHLRIGAIALFGGTLFKLVVYDIRYLDTLPKTLVFISLGIILLIISFLYAKFKNVLFDDDQPSDTENQGDENKQDNA